MNEAFAYTLFSLSETGELLTGSGSELGLLVFYVCYLLMLWKNRKPAELLVQVADLLRDVEESVADMAVKDRVVAELQGLIYVLQHGKAHQYRERIDRILADWRSHHPVATACHPPGPGEALSG